MEAAANGRHIHHEQLRREKLIIDTDPGVGAYLVLHPLRFLQFNQQLPPWFSLLTRRLVATW
jgi:hypothetical protein